MPISSQTGRETLKSEPTRPVCLPMVSLSAPWRW
jgi:hypothetical protein